MFCAAKFKLESAFNGTKYACDRTVYEGELECGIVLIRCSIR